MFAYIIHIILYSCKNTKNINSQLHKSLLKKIGFQVPPEHGRPPMAQPARSNQICKEYGKGSYFGIATSLDTTAYLPSFARHSRREEKTRKAHTYMYMWLDNIKDWTRLSFYGERTYVSRYLCSPNLCSPVPMFPGTDVPRFLYFNSGR